MSVKKLSIKFCKLHDGARTPKRATRGSAAFDIYLPCSVIIEPGRQAVGLGFSIQMPEDYKAQIDARSGYSAKGMEGYDVSEHTMELISKEAEAAYTAEHGELPARPEKHWFETQSHFAKRLMNHMRHVSRRHNAVWKMVVDRIETEGAKLVNFEDVMRFDCDVLTGKIDSDYRGEVKVIIDNHTDETFWLKAGQRIAQMEFVKVEDAIFKAVPELDPTERGEGGFGSTNK